MKKPVIIAFLVGLVLVIIVTVVAMSGDKGSENETKELTKRQLTQQRREAVISIVTALKGYAAANKNTFPSLANVNKVVAERMKSMPIDPATNKPFVIQSVAPSASHEIQYATKAVCTDNHFAFKATTAADDIALRIQDNLTGFFCYSNHAKPTKK